MLSELGCVPAVSLPAFTLHIPAVSVYACRSLTLLQQCERVCVSLTPLMAVGSQEDRLGTKLSFLPISKSHSERTLAPSSGEVSPIQQ